MTKALPFTESAVRRAVNAARKAGLQVSAVSIAPDGTMTVSLLVVAGGYLGLYLRSRDGGCPP
jgi:hypothetical protein